MRNLILTQADAEIQTEAGDNLLLNVLVSGGVKINAEARAVVAAPDRAVVVAVNRSASEAEARTVVVAPQRVRAA